MKIHLISLGCDKNLVDSEVMLGIIRDRGHELTDDDTAADVIIINTCCFIGDAKEESINVILEEARLKHTGKLRSLIVTGCLAQRYSEEIRSELPEVDAVVGTAAYEEIGELLDDIANGGEKSLTRLRDIDSPLSGCHERVLSTPGHYAFLKIAEGCDKHCTYCVIPSVRGKYRSYPPEQLVSQAEQLAAAGVKELIIVAQETTLYGTDICGRKLLPELLRRLNAIEDLLWIRLQYCYPEEITDELIETMASCEKVCHYIDLPIQHASDEVLKRMGRHTDRAEISSIIERLRVAMPDIAIRTTLISGFPGETEEDYEELLDFVSGMRFERLGVFEYSKEEGTPAARMRGQIKKAVKKARRNAIMELQQSISAEKAAAQKDRRLQVLIEGRLADEDVYVGRTYMDAPDVDGMIFVTADNELLTGDVVTAKVTGASEYDLYGEVIYESAE